MDSISISESAIGVKVSVIMLAYNRGHLILESIKSVLEQSFSDYELLIIDDGSTDNTKDIIENISDSRISYFYTSHTGKMSYLRNFGTANSKGEYIAFIDSDDLWQKDKLKNQVKILNNHLDIGMTFSDVEIFDKNGVFKKGIYNSLSKKKIFYKGSVFHLLISNQMSIYISSVMFRRNCLKKVSLFDEDLMSGDTNFLIRLSSIFDIYIVFDYWTSIRKHDGNFSLDLHEASFQQMMKTLTFFYDSKRINKKLFNESLLKFRYALAIGFWKENNFERSRKELLASWRMNPFFLKPVIRYVWSYLKFK